MTYVSDNELRSWLNIPAGDQSVLANIQLALAAADQAINDYCGRSFVVFASATTKIYSGHTGRIFTADFGAVSLVEESADRSTWTTRDSTTYWAAPDNTAPKYRVESDTPFGRWVRVTATWGYGATVPSGVKQSALLIAGRLYKRALSVTGVEGFGEFGVVRISRSSDPDVVMLLDPLRRVDGLIA